MESCSGERRYFLSSGKLFMTFNRRSQLRSIELFNGVSSLRFWRVGVCDPEAGVFCIGVEGFAGCVGGVGCDAGIDVFCIGVDGFVGCVAEAVCVTFLDGGVVLAIAARACVRSDVCGAAVGLVVGICFCILS